MIRLWLPILAGLALFGCKASHETFEKPNVGLEVPQKLVESVSFNELFIKVFEPKCIGCHGTAGNVNLESWQSANAALGKIEKAVLVSHTMPKSPFTVLSAEQLMLVAAWIKAKGPNDPINKEPSPTVEQLAPNFNSIYSKIIVPKCVACHREGGEAPRVSLNSAAEMIDSPLEIVLPENPDESGLMIVVQPDANKKMPPEKSGIKRLTPEEISTISEWIAQGAKD